MKPGRRGQVLTIPIPGDGSVSRSGGSTVDLCALSGEGFRLLCCISSHVMNLTRVENLARDLTHYAGTQLGFDAAAVYLEDCVESGQPDENRLLKLVAHFPDSAVPFRSFLRYQEAVGIFARTRGRRPTSKRVEAVARSLSPEFELVYLAIPGIAGLGGLMVLARRSRGQRSDDETACLQSIAAVLSGALKREQMMDATSRQSYVDALTGAYDRRYLQHRFGSDVVKAAETGGSVALIFADINGMKAINDGFGHEVGDEVLRRFVRCVTLSIRSSDYVARYGGDEFIIVLDNADSDSGRRVINRIRKRMSAAVLHVGTAVLSFPSSAFGLAVAPDESTDLSSLLRLADSRMYEDKLTYAATARCSTNASA